MTTERTKVERAPETLAPADEAVVRSQPPRADAAVTQTDSVVPPIGAVAQEDAGIPLDVTSPREIRNRQAEPERDATSRLADPTTDSPL